MQVAGGSGWWNLLPDRPASGKAASWLGDARYSNLRLGAFSQAYQCKTDMSNLIHGHAYIIFADVRVTGVASYIGMQKTRRLGWWIPGAVLIYRCLRCGLHMISTHGRCFTFDASTGLRSRKGSGDSLQRPHSPGGDGYARGEGCGLAFLKARSPASNR